MSEPAVTGESTRLPSIARRRNRVQLGRYLNVLMVALLLGSVGLVAPSAQADVLRSVPATSMSVPGEESGDALAPLDDRAPTEITYTGPLTGTVGEDLRLSFVLSVVGGGVMHGFHITFLVNGVTPCNVIESPDGTHWCYWTPTEAGPATATAIFAPGEFGNYQPSSVSAVINIGTTPQQSPTSTTLAAPALVEYGAPVTVTATVSPSPASGTVDFSRNGIPACTGVTVTANGSAECISNGLDLGTHTMIATFNGTQTHAGSTSLPAVIEVRKVQTTLSYTGAQTGTVGNPVTLQADLRALATGNPIGPSATVSFSVGGQSICHQLTDFSGRAACQWTPTAAGPATVALTYAGSSSNLSSEGSGQIAINRKAGTVTVTASPASAPWSNLILIDADVPIGATGTISFRTAAGPIPACAAVPVFEAKATCGVTLDVGTHSVTADYSGDATHANGSGSTNLTVTARLTTVDYNGSTAGTVGGQLAVSARVADQATLIPRIGATVTFALDGASCQAISNDFGVASCMLAISQAGSRTVTSTAAADSHHAMATVDSQVNIQAAVSQMVVLAPTSIDVSLPAAIEAVVGPADGGTVTFSLGQDLIIGCVDIAVTELGLAWSAVCVTDTLPVGDAIVTAQFSGTENYLTATESVTITVNKAPTAIAYTGDTEFIVDGQIQVAARLANVVGGGNEPIVGQELTFTLDGLSCAGLTDASGGAACTLIPVQANESGSLTIEFTGDTTHLAAVEAVTVNVAPATTAVTLTAPEQTTYSASVTLSATVAPSNGEGTMEFAVGDRPISGCANVGLELVEGAWQATCVTSDLPAGEVSLSATYSGTGDYLASFDVGAVTVSPAPTNLVYGGPIRTTVGEETAFGARLTNVVTDDGLAGLPISFGWGEWTCTSTTDDEGFASCSTVPDTVGRAGTLTVEFAGTTEFLGSLASADIVIDPAATLLAYTGPTTATVGEPFAVSADLSVANLGRVSLSALEFSAAPASLSVAGLEIVFTAGSAQCIGRTDGSGHAECHLTVNEVGRVALGIALATTDQLASARTNVWLDVAAAPVTTEPTATQPTTTSTTTEPTTTGPTSTGPTTTGPNPTGPNPPTSTEPPASTQSVPVTSGPSSTTGATGGETTGPSAGPHLPNTGYPTGLVLAVALFLLAAGVSVLMLTRRRNQPREH